MKRIIILTIASTFLLWPNISLSQSSALTLTYNSMWHAAYGQSKPVADFAKEIEKRTNGRVKITIYHAGALTPPVEIYEGVIKGISDIGQACFAYSPGRFPLSGVYDLPGHYPNGIVNSRIANDIYAKYRPKELEDVHVLYLHNHLPGSISTTKPVKKLEDLKGLRIRGVGGSAKIIRALGAIAVSIPSGESYDALKKGVVDGAGSSPNMLLGYKFAEVTKYTVTSPSSGYTTGFFVVMNIDKWKKLPEDIQKIFTEVSSEFVEHTGKCWNGMEDEGYNWAKQRGHEFTWLSADEDNRWRIAVAGLLDEYDKTIEAKGLPVKGKEVLSYREELIKKYSKMYPEVVFK